MGTELGIVALYAFLIIAVALLQVLAEMPSLGLGDLISARDEVRDGTAVVGRLDRALNNCVIGMALFAPAVLILSVKGLSPLPNAILAAQIFLFARVAYVVTYALGVPLLRTLAWAISVFAVIYLYILGL